MKDNRDKCLDKIYNINPFLYGIAVNLYIF